MNLSNRSLVFGLAALAIAACGKTEAPPPPKAAVEAPKAAAPAVDPEKKRLAGEVYVYAYPMVLMDLARQAQLAKTPLDTFVHTRGSGGGASDAAYPNPDMVFSNAWIDLAKGPIELSAPDTKGRYYLIAMLDAWTNVAASLGARTTGTDKIRFVIVGPTWKGTLPGGVTEVRSPTDHAWLLARVRTTGKADEAAAARIQEQLKLAPFDAKKKAKGAAPAAAQPAAEAQGDPREQIAQMDAAAFFTRFAQLLPGNPPVKDDAPMVEKMKKLGIVAGQPFDLGKVDALSATSVREGAKAAYDAIVMAAKGSGSADVVNGWVIDRDLGRWGTDYGKRAVSAWRGLGINAPEDAIFMTAHFDGGGRRLDGSKRYVLHFDAANMPPADGFWSIAVYDDKQQFAANRLNRNHLQNGDLKPNADGSVDILIQAADPGAAAEANWLPSPKGAFVVIVRVYWPKQDLLNGRWSPPGIKLSG